jgi:hypothetical protein
MTTQATLMVALLSIVACTSAKLPDGSDAGPLPQESSFECNYQRCYFDAGGCLDEDGGLILTGRCFADRGRMIWYLNYIVPEPYRTGCRMDSDCLVVEASISCQYSCPVAVVQARAGDYVNARDAFDSQTCPRVASTCGCQGDCPAPDGGICRCGACFVNFGLTLPSCDAGS